MLKGWKWQGKLGLTIFILTSLFLAVFNLLAIVWDIWLVSTWVTTFIFIGFPISVFMMVKWGLKCIK